MVPFRSLVDIFARHWQQMTDIYEYQTINVSNEPSPDPHGIRRATIETAANRWAAMGWRTVGVMPSRGIGYADAILIERKKTDD